MDTTEVHPWITLAQRNVPSEFWAGSRKPLSLWLNCVRTFVVSAMRETDGQTVAADAGLSPFVTSSRQQSVRSWPLSDRGELITLLIFSSAPKLWQQPTNRELERR